MQNRWGLPAILADLRGAGGNRAGRETADSYPVADDRGQVDGGEKVRTELIVAGADAAEILQPRKRALDGVPPAVKRAAAWRLPAAVEFGRDTGVAPCASMARRTALVS